MWSVLSMCEVWVCRGRERRVSTVWRLLIACVSVWGRSSRVFVILSLSGQVTQEYKL